MKYLPLCIFLIFISCDKVENPLVQDKILLITKLDINKLQTNHLSQFKLVRKQGRWREGREYVFSDKNNENNCVFIRVGIHPSVEEVHEVANEYNGGCSIVPQEDSEKLLGIGDKLWWMPDPVTYDTVGYHFIRYNSFIIVNSHTYQDLKELVRVIDADLIKNDDYVERNESISIPSINSIQVTQQVLSEGDTTKIIIEAIDPNNEDLEYITIGVSQWNEDPKNVFTLVASRDFIPEPFLGSHIYEFIVINESNVVSRKAAIEIKIK